VSELKNGQEDPVPTRTSQPITSVEFVCVNRVRVKRDDGVSVATSERDLVQVRVTE